MEFGIHVPVRLNCYPVGDPLTFPSVISDLVALERRSLLTGATKDDFLKVIMNSIASTACFNEK